MSYVVYNKQTTRLLGHSWDKQYFATERAAKSALTRAVNKSIAAVERKARSTVRPVFGGNPVLLDRNDWAIAPAGTFHCSIEKTVTKRNLLSGTEFTQPVNTPLCCDPSSETYFVVSGSVSQ